MADPELAVWGTDWQRPVRARRTPGATWTRPSAAAPTWCTRSFVTQRVEHAFLEPESTLAVPRPDGGLHVYSGGQGVWDDRNQIAAVLGVDADRVSVELVSNGGAFGGKEDMSNQAQTALAAWLLRPAREVHPVPGGELPHAPQAPSHPHGVLAPGATKRAG